VYSLDRTSAAVAAVVLLVLSASEAWTQTAPIIRNPAPDPDAPAFRISERPVFQVGGLNNDPNYELIWWPSDVEVTASGEFLVAPADGRTAPLGVRVFGSDGRYKRTIGRRGQGPGEFASVRRLLTLPGDSLAVFDATKQRVSIFDAMGNPGRTITNVSVFGGISASGFPLGHCCFSDWTYLAAARQEMRPRSEQQRPRDTIPWMIAQAGSTAPGREILRLEDGDPIVSVGRSERGANLGLQVPFSRSASVEITDTEIVYGMPDTYEYRVYSRTGALNRIVRADVRPVPVTSAIVAQVRARGAVGATDESAPLYMAAYQRVTFPATQPAYFGLLTERDGAVWVRGFEYPITRQWWARFDRTGRLLGTLLIPPNRNVLRFTRGHVVLTHRDSNEGTTTVYVHRIELAGTR
jgi:hypothetical protein